MKKISPRDLLIFLGLSVAAIVFWQARVIAPATRPEGFFQIDFYTFMFPMYQYGFGELSAGRIPLWTPYAYSGIPFLATYQPGILYPGNFLFLFIPTGLAMGMTAVLHIFLTACFMFLLGRSWGWSRTASGVAALTWTYSHNAVWFYGPVCFLESAAWIPLMVLGIERTCSGRRLSGAALLAFAGTMSLLAGGLQTFVYGAYALAFIAAVRFWLVLRREGPRRAVSVTMWLFLGAMTAGALASPQLLPTYNLSRHTERAPGALPLRWSGNSMEPAYTPPGDSYQGGAAESSGIFDWRGTAQKAARGLAFLWTLRPRELPVLYFGVLPPLLGIAALFGNRRALSFAIAAGAGVALVLSLGPHTPIYTLYHALPTGAWFRNPVRFALLVSFSMAALAGLGINGLEQGGESRRRGLRAACVTALAGLLVITMGVDSTATYVRTAAVAILGLVIVAALAVEQPAWMRRAAPLALVLLLFTDFFFAYRNPYLHPQTNPETLEEHADISSYLRTHLEGERVLVADNAWESWSIQAKYGLLHRVRALNNFEPLTPTVYKTVFHLLDSSTVHERAPFDGHLQLNPHRMNKTVLDLLSVRYVLVDRGLTAEWEEGAGGLGLKKVPIGNQDVVLYENPGARPRASLVEGAVIAKTEADAAGIIGNPEFNPREVVVLQGASDGVVSPGGGGPRASSIESREVNGLDPQPGGVGKVRILHDEADRVEVEAVVPPGGPQWLVLMDLDFPGWRATVDGVPSSIFQANLVGRAIQLHQGSHRIVFRYEDRMFGPGCWIALGTAGAWGLGLLASGVRKRRLRAVSMARRVLS